MTVNANPDRIHGHVGELLRANKMLIAVELGIFSALCFARIFPFSVQLILLIFASLSLLLRNSTWADVGLRRGRAWWKIVLWALLAAGIMAVIANVLVQPLVDRLVSRPVNNSRFADLPGHLTVLLGWLSAVWTVVAFGEEMVFRGYLMNRIADLAGRSRAGWAAALLGSSLIFGLAHGYQGLAGIVGTSEVGLLLGTLYLIFRRNLWVNIACHGFFDSISLVALYFS